MNCIKERPGSIVTETLKMYFIVLKSRAERKSQTLA